MYQHADIYYGFVENVFYLSLLHEFSPGSSNLLEYSGEYFSN